MGLIRNDYAGMGPTAICRKLATECGVNLHIATVRQWMAKAGITTERRSSYHISNIDMASRAVPTNATTPERIAQQRRHCLPPRLFRERHAAPLVNDAVDCRASVAPEFELRKDQAADQERTTSEHADASVQHCGRTPSMAELDALFAERGTSADALDEFAVNLAIQLMEKLGRPVAEAEIEAYIDECEPHLQPLLRLIDSARDAETERRKRRGKRLNFEQRQAILRLLRRDVRPADIARAFNISPGAIATYKRQLNAMDDAIRPSHLT
jgi:DNA-binding CsgD family transcriptional regulator